MDRNITARISDYFTCWKLKVLLQKGQSQIDNFDLSIGGECSLDYSIWRRHLEGAAKDGPKGTVRVSKVNAEDDHGQNTSQDFLLNYTFDLSLDNHMLGRAQNNQPFQQC